MQDSKFQFIPASTPEEASDRTRLATQTWANTDDNFLHIVEKIVHTMQTDPAKYKMFAQMLIAS